MSTESVGHVVVLLNFNIIEMSVMHIYSGCIVLSNFLVSPKFPTSKLIVAF